ncbi:MAG: helix-turn-helix transcriptional regulator [Clostridia bacterium]|nr:helix-turn-helix transcriptional regulator [Clostridia bacterium]
MWQLHPIERAVRLSGFYTAFQSVFSPDYVFRGESHDFYELVLIVSGSLGITAGSNSFVLEGPAAVLHPPMEFHALRAERGTAPELLIFSFEATAIPIFQKRIFSLSEKNIQRARNALALLKSSNVMNHNAEHDSIPVKTKEAQRALMEIETVLLTLSESDLLTAETATSTGDRNYRRALQVMEEHLELSLDTAELAKLAHISPSLLKKLFARYAGVGVMEYFRTRKVNAAIPFLREGSSVQEVAGRFGFSTPGYFATVFRKITGHPPSYYHDH